MPSSIENLFRISDLGPLSQVVIEKTNTVLSQIGINSDYLNIFRTIILFIGVVVFSMILWWLSRKVMVLSVNKLASKSKTKWDDYLVEKRFFAVIANLVPLIFMDNLIKMVFVNYQLLASFMIKMIDVVIVFVLLIATLRFLSTFQKILSEKESLKDKPLHSYFQLGKILISGFMIILGLSIATGQSPIYFLTSLGAATAILLLVFKDTMFGFVGSIQLAANDMIRIGDWITMEKFGADGDVVEITLNTVKVQNFDKTITTIPTYSFISDSFKNWRGMEKSDGRRIKRALNIELNSIQFCSSETLNKLQNIDYLNQHIQNKETEISLYNSKHNIKSEFLLNGRHQTNIGLYREYVTQYLKNNPNINQNMTLMVRQLPSSPLGVPIEIYCFSNEKDWAIYETIVADIFDHLYAATSYFDLTLFEQPSGQTLSKALNKLS